MKKEEKTIAIIGGGNLGMAIAEGLIKSQFVTPQQITITRRNVELLENLKSQGVHVTSDNAKAIQKSEVIIVALKPYNVKDVLEGLKSNFDRSKHTIISVVTGVFLKELTAIVDHGVPIFRAMPNTAIAIQESVTCLCHQGATDSQVKYVTDLFDVLGIAVPIDEKLMDAATVLGACGIAFALRFIRASTQGGLDTGFDAKTGNLVAGAFTFSAAITLDIFSLQLTLSPTRLETRVKRKAKAHA